MSVKRAEKNNRRKAKKASKNKSQSKRHVSAPIQSTMDAVRPRLIEYIRSEQNYLDIFMSLEKGQVYLVATESDGTRHLVLSQQDYLEMMPKQDWQDMEQWFALLQEERVVAYTEDDTGFMTYAFDYEEVVVPSETTKEAC